jgi:hypothetical protein
MSFPLICRNPTCNAYHPPQQYAMSFPLVCRKPIFTYTLPNNMLCPSPLVCRNPIFRVPSPTICYVLHPNMQEPNIHITLADNTIISISFPLIWWIPSIADMQYPYLQGKAIMRFSEKMKGVLMGLSYFFKAFLNILSAVKLKHSAHMTKKYCSYSNF